MRKQRVKIIQRASFMQLEIAVNEELDHSVWKAINVSITFADRMCVAVILFE